MRTHSQEREAVSVLRTSQFFFSSCFIFFSSLLFFFRLYTFACCHRSFLLLSCPPSVYKSRISRACHIPTNSRQDVFWPPLERSLHLPASTRDKLSRYHNITTFAPRHYSLSTLLPHTDRPRHGPRRGLPGSALCRIPLARRHAQHHCRCRPLSRPQSCRAV